MAKPKDITGQVFGMLTAVKRVESDKKVSKWLCSCSCGGEKVVSLDSLRSGSTQSCGCKYKEMGKRIALDLSGQRFGKLVAVSVIHRKPWFPEWVCKCDCGNETTKRSVDLRSGNVKSCGCLKAETARSVAKDRIKSVVGTRSGRLVAIADAEPFRRKDGRVVYRSLC